MLVYIWELPATKELTTRPNKPLTVPKSTVSYFQQDLTLLISSLSSIHHAWVTKWQDLNPTNKLAALKKTLSPGTHAIRSAFPENRNDAHSSLHRLYLTHPYSPLHTLFAPTVASLFPFQHIQCSELTNLRNIFSISPSHCIALFEKSISIQNIITYLHQLVSSTYSDFIGELRALW